MEQKRQENLQRIQSLRLLDDEFMNKVFEDKACAELLLQKEKITREEFEALFD